MYFYYQKIYLQDQSIQKYINFILKKSSLVIVSKQTRIQRICRQKDESWIFPTFHAYCWWSCVNSCTSRRCSMLASRVSVDMHVGHLSDDTLLVLSAFLALKHNRPRVEKGIRRTRLRFFAVPASAGTAKGTISAPIPSLAPRFTDNLCQKVWNTYSPNRGIFNFFSLERIWRFVMASRITCSHVDMLRTTPLYATCTSHIWRCYIMPHSRNSAKSGWGPLHRHIFITHFFASDTVLWFGRNIGPVTPANTYF